MATLPVGVEAVQKQLDEVLKSRGFARNERLSRFLRFIVERHLEGRDRELKESVIGIEVFGRKPTMTPSSIPSCERKRGGCALASTTTTSAKAHGRRS